MGAQEKTEEEREKSFVTIDPTVRTLLAPPQCIFVHDRDDNVWNVKRKD